MELFQAFCLTIASELPLPQLLRATALKADVHIQYAKVSRQALSNMSFQSPYVSANAENYRLFVPNIAHFWVADGQFIVIEAEPGVDEESLQAFVLGPCFQALLKQRGLVVWSGNAVKIGDKAVSFLAPSGYGKSSLAYLLMQQGYPLLSDDLCAMEPASQRLLPSFPQISLWGTMAAQLGQSTQGLKKIRSSLDKFALPVQAHFHSQALPLERLIILDYHKQEQLQWLSVPAGEQWTEFQCDVEKLYCPRWDYGMNELGLLFRHFFAAIEMRLKTMEAVHV
jgi:hypothetical protein